MTMNTEELATILGRLPPPKAPVSIPGLAAAATVVFCLLTLAAIGPRAGFYAGDLPLSFWVKTGFLISCSVFGVYALNNAAKPVQSTHLFWPSNLLASLAGALIALEWMAGDPHQLSGQFATPNFPFCLLFVSVYGLLGMAAFVFVIRRYAPSNAQECAGLIGFASAMCGAVGYSIHCPFDSPTFVVIAYGLPAGALWALARAVIPRYIKW